MTLLSASNEQTDYFGWSQDPAQNGDQAEWDEYASTFTAGQTYHTDGGSNGLSPALDYVTITSKPMLVKDASYVSLKAATRSNGKITLTGHTSQWSEAGDYGSGGVVNQAEAVTVQLKRGDRWVTVKTVRSAKSGAVAVSFDARTAHTYRFVIKDTHALNNSQSGVRQA